MAQVVKTFPVDRVALKAKFDAYFFSDEAQTAPAGEETFALESSPLSEVEFDRVASILSYLPDGGESLPLEFAVRYCRGWITQLDVPQTVEKLKKNLAWRQENNIDRALDSSLENEQLFNRDGWKAGLYGSDKEGHPLVCEQLKEIDITVVTKTFSIEQALVLRSKQYEKIQAIKNEDSETTRKRIYKHVYILDLNGLGLKHIKKKMREPIKSIMSLGQGMYPETLYRMFLLNTPVLFRGLWKILKPFIDPITFKKIILCSGDYLPLLKEHGIDADQLPHFMGGTFEGNRLGPVFNFDAPPKKGKKGATVVEAT